MRISIFKVKQGKKNELQKWGEEIEKRKEEATKTLIEENCTEESIRFFEISGDTYAVGVMVAGVGQTLVSPNLSDELNQKHIKILNDCFLSELPLEKMYSIKVD